MSATVIVAWNTLGGSELLASTFVVSTLLGGLPSFFVFVFVVFSLLSTCCLYPSVSNLTTNVISFGSSAISFAFRFCSLESFTTKYPSGSCFEVSSTLGDDFSNFMHAALSISVTSVPLIISSWCPSASVPTSAAAPATLVTKTPFGVLTNPNPILPPCLSMSSSVMVVLTITCDCG